VYIIEGKVYHHMVKCGGQSFAKNLIDQRPDDVMYLKAHMPFFNLNDKYKDYEHFGVVRDPVSWYKSVFSYHHQLRNEGKEFNNLITKLADGADYAEFVRRATNVGDWMNKNPNIQKEMRDFLLKSKRNIYSYYTMFFPDLNDMFIDSSLYEWFMNLHNMYNIETFKLGDNAIYDKFGIKPLKVINETKEMFKITIHETTETKQLITKADEKAYDVFKF